VVSSRILIIDDDVAFSKLTEIRIRSFLPDSSVTCARSIKEVSELFEVETRPDFDLIFLDEHLPDGNGLTLLNQNFFANVAVVTVTADETPEIASRSLRAGSVFFLQKSQISEKLFAPMVIGLIERNKIQSELSAARDSALIGETVRTLVATLKHEINNPLGAVFGAAYLLKSSPTATDSQIDAARLVEQSGKRIKQVLDQLCEEVNLAKVQKADHVVFQLPRDKEWKVE
jgi:DNA-binding NarL/FixJ family response regulator